MRHSHWCSGGSFGIFNLDMKTSKNDPNRYVPTAEASAAGGPRPARLPGRGLDPFAQCCGQRTPRGNRTEIGEMARAQ